MWSWASARRTIVVWSRKTPASSSVTVSETTVIGNPSAYRCAT